MNPHNPLNLNSKQDFEASIIAQDNKGDHDDSGYVVCFKDGLVGIANYSHCSCYGTWTAVRDGGCRQGSGCDQGEPSFGWVGPVVDFLRMANNGEDPGMPGRHADPKDCDYTYLMAVYQQSIAFFAR
jgi:hypothetical protein